MPIGKDAERISEGAVMSRRPAEGKIVGRPGARLVAQQADQCAVRDS